MLNRVNGCVLVSQELSELAISTYKHIGRMRFARLIGMELAELYLSLGQHDKAATFLSSALQGAQDDSWPSLAARTQLRLVRCFSDAAPDIKLVLALSSLPCFFKDGFYDYLLAD